MMTTAPSKTPMSIAFVLDPRLPRERASLLARTVNHLRQIGQIQVFSGDIEEKDLIREIEAKRFNMVLVPWYHYLKWGRVEAAIGLTRTTGIAFAGYFCDELHPSALGESSDHLRNVLLDFSAMNPVEIVRLTKSLIHEGKRSGIQPLLQPGATIYCDPWYRGETLGSRIDAVFSLSELTEMGWLKRSNAIRSVISSLWSVIYDEGLGKKEPTGPSAVRTPIAYFQVGMDQQALVFRLCYSAPLKTPKSALAAFWPDAKRPTAAPQLLLRHADFVRVHTVAETSDIELTIGLLESAPSERSASSMHTLWVEPISQALITENPAVAPGPNDPRLKPLHSFSNESWTPRADAASAQQPASASAQAKAKAQPQAAPPKERTYSVVELTEVAPDALAILREESLATDAAKKIAELNEKLASRDALIAELRSGGVGIKASVPTQGRAMEFDQLAEAFQQRYFDTRFQIKQLEVQIAELARTGSNPQELEDLRMQHDALARREQDWIRKIGATIDLFQKGQAQKKAA